MKKTTKTTKTAKKACSPKTLEKKYAANKENEIKAYLKEHLKVKVNTQRHPGGYDDMTLQLLIDDDVISQAIFFTRAK